MTKVLPRIAAAEEAPLRAELFSTDQMEHHGRLLADRHRLGRPGTGERLLERLADNAQSLAGTCAALAAAAKARQRIAPAGEWLLDNAFLIQEQVQAARRHLPKGYSRELPLLAEGPSAGLPRVYDLALASVAHGDGRLDGELLARFIAAYQSQTALTLGELWAIPIMLRLALIENLRRVGVRVGIARDQAGEARDWARQMMATAESDPKSLILVIADMARSSPPMDSPFVAELTRRLQGHGPALALALTWIEQRLGESSQTIEQMVLAENQRQAADQVSISNSIGSLRLLGGIDWRDFVEANSVVERILREDAEGGYAGMDFGTRDRYRHVVARLARRTGLAEAEVARIAVDLACTGGQATPATAHVGYYLIDGGLPALEAALSGRARLPVRWRESAPGSPLPLHLGAIMALTGVVALGLAALAVDAGIGGWQLALLAAPALFGASQLASTLVNWLATLLVAPVRLPRMDFSRGLPPGSRTVVVVPTLLDSAGGIDGLLESLEVRFLGNRDAHIHFGLLTDLGDAPQQVMPQDEALLSQVRSGIDALNVRYPGVEGPVFFLLHRPRLWNAVERTWMGFERKRGKLADLNAALRGDAQDRFALVVGDLAVLATARYVITLDTDTDLPRDAARQVVATMAHPLNRPRYDRSGQRIVAGYGILQPRMAASLSGANQSRYSRLFGNEPGIDPYTRSVSDVYQDLFGEGSFIGKGIYDIDAFERATCGRFPDNLILSHDLLEGCYARSGLLSDVHLHEDHPARYEDDVGRRTRWIRGDWQILQWLLPRVPGPDGEVLDNPLSALSRWKILDNLRRSLVPAALLALLLLGWAFAPQAWGWTLGVLAVVLAPVVLQALLALLRKHPDIRLLAHLGAAARNLRQDLKATGFRIACLPHEAWYSLDATLRSLWRLLVSRRRMLEWRVASARRGGSLADAYRSQWMAPASAVAGGLLVGYSGVALAIAAPLLVLWLLAPALSWWLSQPLVAREARLTADQGRFLRRLARKTWAFFERFVGAEDHWLPPDNFQHDPGPVVAHRTSPTNIGLALLANLSAWDFGYLGTGALLQRTRDTFATLDRLERHHGHFYNWYDTRTLQPLPPRYVSSVDSGNLGGHLLTLRAGLLALPDQPLTDARCYSGLADTLLVLSDLATSLPAITALQSRLDAIVSAPPTSPAATVACLESLAADGSRIADELAIAGEDSAAHWAQAFERQCRDTLADLRLLLPDPLPAPAMPSLRDLAADSATARERIAAIEDLARRASGFATMDYGFLYDSASHLLAIGYNADELRRDASRYDLLASEARQACFVAIAQGQLPQESWFALGRLLTTTDGDPVLVSWSGSMFEYLMPMLVMPSYPGSLLAQTCAAAVARQIAHGEQHGLPWGISESGYNAVDAGLAYQYHAFGVPGLGLQRGLSGDYVVAPYASALALMVAPEVACANLQRLAASGLEGEFGLYEAIDFTPSRVLRGASAAVVRSFMAHHQGMSLLSLAHLLLDRPMQRRFQSDPQVQATLLLLQERIPRASVRTVAIPSGDEASAFADATLPSAQAPMGAFGAAPEVQLLSNGRYHVMVSNAGGGYSRWRDLAVTRWREDGTRDHWGAFAYLRDPATGEFWSATHQPTLKRADSYEALFCEGRAEYRRRDHDIETHTDIVVSQEDDVELRRVRVSNRSGIRRSIEVTSYGEIVLAPPAADMTQTAFGNLFVQTEIVPGRRAILGRRRPRSREEPTPWMFHLLAANGTDLGEISYETDRMRFIGRGRNLSSPRVMAEPGPLSGSAGPVLDPITAIRCRVVLEPEQTAILDFITGVADNRDACMALVDKYQDRHLADRVLDLAGSHSAVALRQINATESDARLYRQLAGAILHAHASLRAEPALLAQNTRGQSGLWGYAISGDLPIVLLRMADGAHLELARQLIQCHAYWRQKGLAVDLVIWNEDHVGYRQKLQDQIVGLIATGSETQYVDRPGGIFVRSSEQIPHVDRVLLQAVARAILVDSRGSLAEQLAPRARPEPRVPRLVRTRTHRHEPPAAADPPRADLQLGTGLGGFSADGREYVITTAHGHETPLPWVNVLANAGFGTIVTESGPAYTWAENAHEYRLTPWSDDPVGAASGEAFYLRDEESGHVWSPSPQPCRGAMPYTTRHGFGYSVYEHTSGGIHSELWVYVDLVDAVKFSVLKVRNGSGRRRRLSATGYVDWVLGELRPRCAMHVVTEIDAGSGALFARNAFNSEFAGRVAFFDVDDASRSLSGDRREFLGRNGSLSAPDALTRAHLSGRVGAGLDPCGALQVPFELADGEEREIIFRLGAGRDLADARALASRLRQLGSARSALERVRAYWQQCLGNVQFETPDRALDLLANGWLVYQTLACRVLARSGYYQSGGAFGFRDQLQDTMALVHARPDLLREHLLRSAGRQYPEGDVQHWWHPPAGRGVRTRCSDDYLWLPLAACRYVQCTGDESILDEQAPFLEGRALQPGEESYYDLPGQSADSATVYQHCLRAIEHGLRFGERGLPLMGSGDWNDGMNLVGIHGRGESVWLGFFLHDVLVRFADLAERRHDGPTAARCRERAQALGRSLEQHAWDGAWYRRAWFDDGTPLGSSVNDECSIDSISQSWSVLSGVAGPVRAAQAMASLDRRLVRRDHGLVQLLDPPFDQSAMDPGYIRGYLPGVRENGGQYTHAAVWAAMAFAAQGNSDRAWELLGLINPVNHGRDDASVATYRAEPYVVAADVYGVAPHIGRGGWTWYTGSAGWLYRLALESLMGVSREGDSLRIVPCLPAEWTECAVSYRFGSTTYRIRYTQVAATGDAGTTLSLDGADVAGDAVTLVDDGREHLVGVRIRR